MNPQSLYEIVIVGAGPAGISLAVEATKKGIAPSSMLVLEKFENHSWSIRKFYPDDKLVTANYKGNDVSCTGTLCLLDSSKEETLDYLGQAIKENKIPVHYKHSVSEIKKLRNGQYVVCANDECFVTKTVAIAIGVLGKPNRPDYPIPAEINSQVLFDVTSKEIRGKKVLVVGGGDSASEYVQFLVERGNDVSLSYRRDSFMRMNDINKNSLELLGKSGKADLLNKTNIKSLEKIEDKVKVNFEERDSLEFDYIVYALGGSTPKDFLTSIGISMTKEGPEVSDFFESEQEGVFLLGDLSAGKGGGSINVAFNSSHKAMEEVCNMYLDCKKS
jgi:thioredoxin reductase (NADPH)